MQIGRWITIFEPNLFRNPKSVRKELFDLIIDEKNVFEKECVSYVWVMERERDRKEGEEDKERMCGCVWMRVDVCVWVRVCDARRREKEREREMKRESIVIVVFGRFLSSDRLAGHQMKLLTQLLPFPLSSKRTHRHSPSLSLSLSASLSFIFSLPIFCVPT